MPWQAVGAHIEYEALNREPEKPFEYAKSVGIPAVIISHLRNEDIINKEVIKRLNELCDLAIDYQLKLCYHNHNEEFKKINDSTVLDILIRSVPKMDIELDPVAYMGSILQAGEKMKVPWAFVEMNQTDGDQMACSSISRINLLKMGY